MRSLAEYAWLLRSVPLLLLVLVLFLVSLGLRWLPHFTKPRNELPDSRELADSPHSPLTSARQAAGRGSLEEGPGIGVQRAKPDLPQLVSQQAALGPTEAAASQHFSIPCCTSIRYSYKRLPEGQSRSRRAGSWTSPFPSTNFEGQGDLVTILINPYKPYNNPRYPPVNLLAIPLDPSRRDRQVKACGPQRMLSSLTAARLPLRS